MQLQSILQKKSYFLALVSFIVIIAISLMKSAMELEDAEQAYFSQWFRFVYDDQPPLYTWLQYGINSVFGISVVSFSLLRAIIFASIIVVLYKFSETYLNEVTKANLVIFSLAIIPVFIDFTFRRLSHTSLLCLAVVLTYMLLQNLIAKKTIRNYVLLGVVVAFGVLAKYNYVLVMGAIALVSFIDENVRKIIWNKNIIISILITGLLVAPHFYELLSNQEFLSALRASVELKTMGQEKTGLPVLSPIFTMLLTLVKVVLPIFVIFLVFTLFKKVSFNSSIYDWLAKTMFAQLTVIALFFIFMNVQKTEERWFLPLLLPFLPLLLKSITFEAIKKWETKGFYLFLFILFAQAIRTPIEKLLKIPSDVHFGFQPISDVLNSKYANEDWVMPNVTYAGNVKLLNSRVPVYAADDFSLPEFLPNKKSAIKVLIGKDGLGDVKVLDSLVDFGRRKQMIYFIRDDKSQ